MGFGSGSGWFRPNNFVVRTVAGWRGGGGGLVVGWGLARWLVLGAEVALVFLVVVVVGLCGAPGFVAPGNAHH